MDEQIVSIPPIILKWSEWFRWDRFLLDARSDPSAIAVPDDSGVYEVRVFGNKRRLTIGKASNLRMRIKQGLIKGKVPHSTGRRIRKSIDVSRTEIRWAVTDRPAAVEEELHLLYEDKHGELPEFTLRT